LLQKPNKNEETELQMNPNQYPEISDRDLLTLADTRAGDPLITELAARLDAALDSRAEINLLRARQAQARATLELVLHRYGAPGEVTAALKKVLSL
jgi:hypothetical protein